MSEALESTEAEGIDGPRAPPGTSHSSSLAWQALGPQGTELLSPFLIILVPRALMHGFGICSGPGALGWQGHSVCHSIMSDYGLTGLAVWLTSASLPDCQPRECRTLVCLVLHHISRPSTVPGIQLVL